MDDDGSVVGVKNVDKALLAATDRIKNNILSTYLRLFDVYAEEKQGKVLIHIVISAGTEKPYYLKSSGMSPRGCFIRVGTGIKQMEISMIESLFASRTRNSFRNIISPHTVNTLFS